MSERRLYAFSNGCQYMDWCARNCERCQRWNPEGPSGCEIDMALLYAYMGDGKVAETIARRMGLLPDNELAHTWPCPERWLEGAPEPVKDDPNQVFMFEGVG